MQKNRKEQQTEVMTLNEVAEEFYRNNVVRGLADATCETYKTFVGGFIKWFGGYRNIAEILPSTFDDYILFNKENGIRMVTIASKMTHIRRYMNFAVERKYIEPIKVPVPRYEKTLKEPYTDAELARLLARPRTRSWVEWRNWAMVNYFVSTGQRLSTVLNIRIEDIDIETQTVRLIWNKDKRQKIMPFSSALADILKEYMELSEFDDDEYLFPHVEGGQLHRRSAQDAVAEYNHSRGVDKTSIHLFRHTFAKNYIVSGGNPMKLQKLLNHKSMDMTLRYVNLYDADMKVDLDLFDPLARYKNASKGGNRRHKLL